MALESSTVGSQAKDGSPRVTEHSFGVILGQPRLLTFKEGPFRIQIADETVLGYSILKNDPRELSLEGRREGSTVLKLWVGDRHDTAKQTVLSYRVNVFPQDVSGPHRKSTLKDLENQINQIFPDSLVCLELVGDKLIVSGQVKDPVEATKILQVIRASAVDLIPVRPNSTTGMNPDHPINANDYIVSGAGNLINLLRIPGEK